MKIMLIYYRIIIFCVLVERINPFTKAGKDVILDMSKVFRDAMDDEHIASSILEKVFSESKTTEPETKMYLELDLQNTPGLYLRNLIDFLAKQNSGDHLQTKLFVSFIDSKWSAQNDNMTLYIQEYFSSIQHVLIEDSSLFEGVSVELGNVGYHCNQHSQNLVQNLKELIANEESNIMVGYALNLDHINCSVHTENIKHSDYVIINIPLQLNDGVFVESYGIFKENMDNVLDLVTQNSILTNKSLHYKVSLNGSLNRGELKAYKLLKANQVYYDHTRKNVMTNSQSQLNQAGTDTARRYEELLTKYVHVWKTDGNNNLKIILTYIHGYPITMFDEPTFGWMQSKPGTVPYLTNFDFLENKSQLNSIVTLSANILLQDVTSSGFDTVMLNEKIWIELAARSKDLKHCNRKPGKCRPNHAICVLDGSMSLVEFHKKEMHKLRNIRGMKVKTVYFSSDKNVGEAIPLQWSDFLRDFRGNSKAHLIGSACRSWFGVLNNFPRTCDNGCIGNTVRQVTGCGSIKNISNEFVWRVRIYFQSENKNEFVDKTMKRLDAFVIARQLVKQDYPNKTVTLQIAGAFHGKSNDNLGKQKGVYCNSLGRRVSQFYEAILTWATIHNFPVILVPVDGIGGIGNPLVWTKLTMSESNDPLHELMNSVPIYVRRSFNESRMVGSYMQGMYSCIHKASTNTIANLKFEHEFSGVTLNFTLRQAKENLKVDEVQTLLLLVLEKFEKVEIILETFEEMENLRKVLLRPNFEQVLKERGMPNGKKIYIQVKKIFSEVTISALTKLGFKVYITSHFHLGHDHINKLNSIFSSHEIGTVHPNCSTLAYDLVARKPTINKSLNKAHYLVCETLPIAADNLNVEKIQNYMNSHLYLTKLMQSTYPNLKEIHFRLQSTYSGIGSQEQNENLLMFLSDLNNYAKAYKINYFLLPAFVAKNDAEIETSFWKITDYNNLVNTSELNNNEIEIKDTTKLLSSEAEITYQLPEKSPLMDDMPIGGMFYAAGTEVDHTTETNPDDHTSDTDSGDHSSETDVDHTSETSADPASETDADNTSETDADHTSDTISIPDPEGIQITGIRYTELNSVYSKTPGDQMSPVPSNNFSLPNSSTLGKTNERSNYGKKNKKKGSEDSTSEILTIVNIPLVSALSILIIIVTMLGCVKYRITHSYLSAKDMRDFLNGRQETLEEAAHHRRRKKRFTGSIFDGLMFQKEFNLSKGDVDINAKVILGVSKFCTVHRGRMHDGQTEVVVKVAKKNCSKEIFKGLLSEVKLLCYLGDHCNIVKFMGCYKKEIRWGTLWIAMEFCSGGTLHNYLMGKRENIGNEQGVVVDMIRFSQEIACGMEYIAKQNIVHGDLCAANVLLNSHNNCKIKCFGLSRKLQEYQGFMKRNQHEKILPWRWMAPESLRKLDFSTQSDIWSYGVTLWEIFSLGDTPHSEVSRTINLTGDLEKGMQLRNPDYATKEIYDIMLECCKLEPGSRPGFSCMVRFFTDLLAENTIDIFQLKAVESEEILNF